MLICFVKGYLISLVCPGRILHFFFYKKNTHVEVSQACQVFNTSTVPQMKCLCFLEFTENKKNKKKEFDWCNMSK